jgi:ribonuclease T1
MSREPASSQPTKPSQTLPPWLIVLLLIGLIGFSWWQNRQVRWNAPTNENGAAQSNKPHSTQSKSAISEVSEKQLTSVEQPPSQAEQPATQTTGPGQGAEHQVVQTDNETRRPDSTPSPTRAKGEIDWPKNEAGLRRIQIENQTIRDQDGRVVYRGTIDLQPTLDRIARGDKNSHRNDGTTFQNRERRLPQKPSGYYREYVHPTPKSSGPGPQRVIVGKDGEIWYTPDHYKSFQRIK